MKRIGIDVGGTNTDAILIEEGKVVGAVKAPTSEDVTAGILDSLKALGATGVHYVRGCQLWIEIWSAGVGEPAAYKKYRYGPPLYRIIEIKEPPPKDLNDYLDKRVSIASFEKNIDGDWWIELDHWH